MKSKSVPYSVYYYNEKNRLENSEIEITEYLRHEDRKKKKYEGKTERTVAWKNAYVGHRHKAATRKMIKMFLVDLYIAWSEPRFRRNPRTRSEPNILRNPCTKSEPKDTRNPNRRSEP